MFQSSGKFVPESHMRYIEDIKLEETFTICYRFEMSLLSYSYAELKNFHRVKFYTTFSHRFNLYFERGMVNWLFSFSTLTNDNYIHMCKNSLKILQIPQ